MKRFEIKNTGITVLRLKKASQQDDVIAEKAFDMINRLKNLDRMIRQFEREDADIIPREIKDQSLTRRSENYGRITK